MPGNTLHLDLPDAQPQSIWPWLTALLSGAALVLVASQTVSKIATTIDRNVQAEIKQIDVEGLQVTTNGRDLTMTGTVPIGTDTRALVEQLLQVDGVRVVNDQLQFYDPTLQQQQQRQAFLEALGAIDLSTVRFEPGSSTFAAGSTPALERLAALLLQGPDFRIRVEGHTDNTGPANVNLRVSRERAEAVTSFLMAKGVDPNQLIAKGYGSTQPVASNENEAGRARNRRIEISYVD